MYPPSQPRATEALRKRCLAVLEAAWHPDPGFCVPNQVVYPHQWLWDSCFHSVVWTELGDQRGVTELRSALANQDLATGFVPHMNYWSNPNTHAEFWGREETSPITQPPMYGHALAQAVRAGHWVDADLKRRAEWGLGHLLTDRLGVENLIWVFHPWETGCDDSGRWDAWCPGGYERERWRETKTKMVGALRFDREGGPPVGSDIFQVASAGFNALVVWNALELESVGVAGGSPRRLAAELRTALAAQYDPDLRSWVDPGSKSGRVRTLDSLLPLLVDPRSDPFDDLLDPAAYGSEFGPCGMHRSEPTFDPGSYWRGPAWPQLTYLLAIAARQADRHDVADSLMHSLRSAAIVTDFAEYWNPITGAAGGAAPQTWTTLSAVTV